MTYSSSTSTDRPWPAWGAKSWLALGLLAFLVAMPAFAEGPGEDDEEAARARQLEAQGLLVGEIHVKVDDIFNLDDPKENSLPYRLANRLHRRTRRDVVQDLMVLRTGEPYSYSRERESERLLRGQRFFHDAEIRPGAVHDGVVDLDVEVRDVWTLGLGLSYGRKGGVNTTRFDLHDSNFLGTGKTLAVEHKVDVDRTGTEFSYRDPALGGRHLTLGMAWAQNEDGSPWSIELHKPFDSLDGHLELFGSAADGTRTDHRYLRGEVIGSFRHTEEKYDLAMGLSRGLVDGNSHRWRFGLSYEHHQFDLDPDPDPDWDPELYDPNGPRPDERTIVAPWIGFEYVEDQFEAAHHLDQIDRVEDRYAGKRFRARLGWSTVALGADRDRAIFDLEGTWTRDRGDDLRLALTGSGHGRVSSDGLEDFLIGSAIEAYWRDFGRNIFYARLGLDFAYQLDADDQLLLGGRTGLRGYPLRYQDGDRRFLLTVEQRFYTDWRPLHLAAVGAAVFVDVGRAWFAGGSPFDGAELADGGDGILGDIGFGLRLGSSRTGRGHMLHVDVAFPFGGDPSIDSVQFLVGTFETF